MSGKCSSKGWEKEGRWKKKQVALSLTPELSHLLRACFPHERELNKKDRNRDFSRAVGIGQGATKG